MRARGPLVVALVVAIIGLVLCTGCESTVTRENYDRIQTGMTLSEVEGILGPGEKQTAPSTSISSAGILTSGNNQATEDTYLWKEDGPNEPQIIVIFRDGKVLTKRQTGLGE